MLGCIDVGLGPVTPRRFEVLGLHEMRTLCFTPEPKFNRLPSHAIAYALTHAIDEKWEHKCVMVFLRAGKHQSITERFIPFVQAAMGSLPPQRRIKADSICILGAGPSGLAAAK
jgi:hypothetical protein